MSEETPTTEETTEEVKHVEVQKKTEMLKCNLTSDELLDFGDRLANRQQELQEVNDELKGIKDSYKAKITAIEADEVRLGNLVRQKYEMRKIECDVTFDFDTSEVVIVRLDTNKETIRRPMADNEKQRELKLWPQGETPSNDQNHEPPIGHVEILEAVKILIDTKRPSQTGIQRRMGVNVNRAWMILDRLEQLKVVSPSGEEGRDILMDEVSLQRFLEDYPETAEEQEVEEAQEALTE